MAEQKGYNAGKQVPGIKQHSAVDIVYSKSSSDRNFMPPNPALRKHYSG
jgi:hypothetical protein